MTSTFRVLKYDCASCAMVIEGVLEDTPGVSKAEVNAGKKLLVVEHEPEVSIQQLQSALEAEGYPTMHLG